MKGFTHGDIHAYIQRSDQDIIRTPNREHQQRSRRKYTSMIIGLTMFANKRSAPGDAYPCGQTASSSRKVCSDATDTNHIDTNTSLQPASSSQQLSYEGVTVTLENMLSLFPGRESELGVQRLHSHHRVLSNWQFVGTSHNLKALVATCHSLNVHIRIPGQRLVRRDCMCCSRCRAQATGRNCTTTAIYQGRRLETCIVIMR
jgi:hypothetical protein